ncbi:MAG: hypothetical protein ACOX25_05710 [Caldicoprobacterales bacterium]|nr:hypothetical protein [Clostridiales bacterium]
MKAIGLIAIAIVAESIWETIKMMGKDGKFNWDRIGAMIVGLLIAFGTGADLFQMLGIPFRIPYLGIFLTGMLISRGANFIHDLFLALNMGNEIMEAQRTKIREQTRNKK